MKTNLSAGFRRWCLGAVAGAAFCCAIPEAWGVVPVAANDSVTMHRGQKALIPVLANDTGTITATSVAIVQPPQFGTAVPDSSGRILYAHTSGVPSTDSLTYTVAGPDGVSSPATVTVVFADTLRIANSGFNVPQTPPPVTYQLSNAFAGLTFSNPLALASPPGDTKRLFVCGKNGTLWVIPDVKAAAPTMSTVLTLSATAGGLFNGRTPTEALATSSECGLLGLAFHPNYSSNGYLFITYSVNINGVLHQRLSRLTLNNAGSAAPVANLTSERVLIEQPDQAGNHNGGAIHFGPDGYLYYSIGDEGDQDDSRNNSQKITKDFFSGILRIDVDKRPGNLEPNPHPNPAEYPSNPPQDSVKRDAGIARYSIPADNPFVGATTFNGVAINANYVRTEFWAVGLRNPWRMSFDGNELWVGDVGGGVREEIDIVTRGGNYGWAFREGMTNGPKSVSAPANFDTLYGTRPIYDYAHGSGTFQGNSITGGVVYRGARISSLVGAYIFADYSSGNVWSLRRNGTATPTVTRLTGEAGISAFGIDPSNGDVLATDLDGSRILRLVASASNTSYPGTLSATNLFADLSDLSPSPSLLPYEVNVPFWSDHALKRRWFTIPAIAPKMTWARDSEWGFPAGQIWVKHFDLETTRGNPATRKRIETRVFVRNTTGAYGVSYRWNDSGTDATLVADEGADFPVNVIVDGQPYVQQWRIPSRADCVTCHTPQAGHALSFNTRQLNLAWAINGFAGNQIDLLRSAGYFSNTPDSPNLLPRHYRAAEINVPVEARVRSYLAVNCAYCHKSGGSALPAAWDGRAELALMETGLINGVPANNGGNPENKLIVPGDPAHSIVLSRMAVTNGFSRMPPLGSNELDTQSIALLQEWITGSLPSRQTYTDWRTEQFGSSTSADGEPANDPDRDGRTNQQEFIAGTAPKNGGSFLQPVVSRLGADVSITLSVPVNRSAQIEISTDLANWTLWDAPGNDGGALSPGVLKITGPVLDANAFFRIRLREN